MSSPTTPPTPKRRVVATLDARITLPETAVDGDGNNLFPLYVAVRQHLNHFISSRMSSPPPAAYRLSASISISDEASSPAQPSLTSSPSFASPISEGISSPELVIRLEPSEEPNQQQQQLAAPEDLCLRNLFLELVAAETRLEAARQASRCQSCGKRERAVLFVPCMHFQYCGQCAQETEVCLRCETPIRGKIPVAGA